jgi:hypothetical protein
MSVIYLELAGTNIQDTQDLFPLGHWDGYNNSPIPQAFSQGIALGLGNTWGGLALTTTVNSITNFPYIGYTTNFAASNEPVVEKFINGSYVGYTTNFGGSAYNNTSEFTNTDIDSVIDYPKAQFVYFKLKGFNPNTQTYENWIIKEDITSRPELFDPGRNPPTRDLGVFTTPPSGHALVNIVIVARWIQ